MQPSAHTRRNSNWMRVDWSNDRNHAVYYSCPVFAHFICLRQSVICFGLDLCFYSLTLCLPFHWRSTMAANASSATHYRLEYFNFIGLKIWLFLFHSLQWILFMTSLCFRYMAMGMWPDALAFLSRPIQFLHTTMHTCIYSPNNLQLTIFAYFIVATIRTRYIRICHGTHTQYAIAVAHRYKRITHKIHYDVCLWFEITYFRQCA